jgi:hypothetical protein
LALGYGLDDRDSRVRFPAGAGNFSLHHRVQNGSRSHPASYPKVTRGGLSVGAKLPGREADHSPHLVPRSGMRGAIPPLPQYVFMAWCLVSTDTTSPLHITILSNYETKHASQLSGKQDQLRIDEKTQLQYRFAKLQTLFKSSASRSDKAVRASQCGMWNFSKKESEIF